MPALLQLRAERTTERMTERMIERAEFACIAP
jgi:hypothetical protein